MLDEADELAGPLDVIGRAAGVQDVALLHHRPRLARHQLGASLERFEVHAPRSRVEPELGDRLAIRLTARDHDCRRLDGYRQQGWIVDLRPDDALGVRERQSSCRDDDPVAWPGPALVYVSV